ncbi:glycosyltransferase family 2 protein [bacterium]|nr:glycosyltransferase family 2 protein [bacterium]
MNKPKNTTISAIIPAYNEHQTIEAVINTILHNPLVDEVICINDGSTDNTAQILEKFGNQIQFINLKENKGKGYAMTQGILKAKGEILLFLDADFTNLSNTYIEQLLKPVLEDGYKVSLGYLADNDSSITKKNLASELTGQRVYYKKDLLPHLEKISKTRFGVEVYLNNQFPEEDTKKAPLKGLQALYKYEKFSSSEALKEYVKEAVEIAKVIGEKNGLLSRDYKVLELLSKSKNIRELELYTAKIRNPKIRDFLNRYVLRYIQR